METTIDKPTSGATARAVGDAALRQELRDLYDEIADLLDDDRVEEFPYYFTEDCIYKVILRENYVQGLPAATMFCEGRNMINDRILAIRETQVYEPRWWRHFLSGVRVLAVDGDTIKARANFLVTEAMSDTDPTLFLTGSYDDVLVRRDGRLLFKQRLAVLDNHYVRRSLVMPV